MIRFQGLEKKYGDFSAVHPLQFDVQKGEIFGFLGPNGAGKTTTIRMMMGILVPTAGSVVIDSLDAQINQVEVKKRIGYLPDEPIFYDYLRGREILEFVGEIHGLSRTDARVRAGELLNEFGIADAGEEFAVNYSMGMKKRLGLALALMHRPSILILDEPINGLDPRGAHEIQKKLRDYADAGGTVFLSTHLLDMAEKICNRVGIIDYGKILAVDTIPNLREQVMPGGTLESIFLKMVES
jgi:ABC-2 type transport system ATP-binding protein